MISKEARAFERERILISEQNSRNRRERREEALYMSDYHRCPHCLGKAKKIFWLLRIGDAGNEHKYKCLKCGLRRTLLVD